MFGFFQFALHIKNIFAIVHFFHFFIYTLMVYYIWLYNLKLLQILLF